MNKQYGPYAHFGYLTLVSDPEPNKVIHKVEKWCPKSVKSSLSQMDGVINPQNYNFCQF